MKTMRNVLFMNLTDSIVEKMAVMMRTVAEERAETIFKNCLHLMLRHFLSHDHNITSTSDSESPPRPDHMWPSTILKMSKKKSPVWAKSKPVQKLTKEQMGKQPLKESNKAVARAMTNVNPKYAAGKAMLTSKDLR
jgi:hypothetical protein